MNIFFTETIGDISLEKAKIIIKESSEGFLKLFNSSPACMSITTFESRTYVKVNTRFLEKFGYTEEEIIGHTSIEVGILDPQESEKVAGYLRDKGRLQNDIVICKTKEGIPVYTVSSIEKIEINNVIYLLSSFLDISKIIEQQQIIEKQNKDILESINYASLIQNSILPTQRQIETILPDSFVLSKPKGIVSGDFYWIKKIGNKIFVSACDCTGHGVPGALISIIGFKLLSKYIGEYKFYKPAKILNQLNKEFASANQTIVENINEIKDGMDIALCTIDTSTMIMEYAGAYNPIYLVRKDELIKLEVDKIPIHLFTTDTGKEFKNHSVQLNKGDALYLFSDGYADQFGGPDGKKFH